MKSKKGKTTNTKPKPLRKRKLRSVTCYTQKEVDRALQKLANKVVDEVVIW